MLTIIVTIIATVVCMMYIDLKIYDISIGMQYLLNCLKTKLKK